MTRTWLVGGFVWVVAASAALPHARGLAAEPATQQAQTPRAPKPITGALEKGKKPNDPGALTQEGEKNKRFMTQAALSGMADVLLGRLAALKGTDPLVRRFGQQMVDTHRTTNSELKALATAKHMTLPDDVDASQKATLRRLSQLTGAALDQAVMKEMLGKHTRDRALFQRTALNSLDPEVKAWASKVLPTVLEHQTVAKDITLKVVRVSAPSAAKTR